MNIFSRKNVEKFACLILFLSFVLVSCTGKIEKEGFFDYEKKDFTAEGVWCENGEEYGVILKKKVKTEKNGESMRIEFTSPESIKNTVFLYENGELTATLGDITVSMNKESADSVMRLYEMFRFKSEDIHRISVDDNKNTCAKGENWQVITDKKGNPKEITVDENVFKIKKFN